MNNFQPLSLMIIEISDLLRLLHKCSAYRGKHWVLESQWFSTYPTQTIRRIVLIVQDRTPRRGGLEWCMTLHATAVEKTALMKWQGPSTRDKSNHSIDLVVKVIEPRSVDGGGKMKEVIYFWCQRGNPLNKEKFDRKKNQKTFILLSHKLRKLNFLVKTQMHLKSLEKIYFIIVFEDACSQLLDRS